MHRLKHSHKTWLKQVFFLMHTKLHSTMGNYKETEFQFKRLSNFTRPESYFMGYVPFKARHWSLLASDGELIKKKVVYYEHCS